MTFHPSEWIFNNDVHISVVEIQRDAELFFMVEAIRRGRIFSALRYLLSGAHSNNLLKTNNALVNTWMPKLNEAGFDGWFTSIENKGEVEVAIKNEPGLLKLVECGPVQRDWINAPLGPGETILPKIWGTRYPLKPGRRPIRFYLNRRFESMIEEYKSRAEEEGLGGTAFSILLGFANVSYFDAPVVKSTLLDGSR